MAELQITELFDHHSLARTLFVDAGPTDWILRHGSTWAADVEFLCGQRLWFFKQRTFRRSQEWPDEAHDRDPEVWIVPKAKFLRQPKPRIGIPTVDPFVKPPVFPKTPTSASLTEESFRSDEEIWGERFEGGHAIGVEADHLMLEQVQLQGCVLDSSILYGSRLTDARLDECSLANLVCERLIVRRAEFFDCRLVGLNITDGHLENVMFRECDVQLARFRFSSFKSVLFDGCNLQDANFQGADLSGVRFRKCDLSRAELSQAKLRGTDFRTSVIEGMRVGPKEVVGAVVDHFQAAYMASLLGLVIKDEDENL